MMNVMSAAAQEGSAELPQIKQALEQAGLAAKTANVSFSETNAAIQVLDKAGKKGSEGGVALRNVMTTLAKGRFIPPQVQKELRAAGVDVSTLTDKSKTMAERLRPLQTVMNDNALITKLFGQENSAAAIAILSGIDEIERMNGAIQNTNTAFDYAATVMDTPAEKLKRIQANVDDFKLSMFSAAGGTMTYATALGSVMHDVANLAPLFKGGYAVITTFTDAKKRAALASSLLGAKTKVMTALQWSYNTSLLGCPVFWLVGGVVALTAAIGGGVYIFKKFNEQQNRGNKLTADLAASIGTEQRELDKLFDALKKTNPESEERKRLLEEMSTKYPGFLGYQALEKANEEEIEKARRKANAELRNSIGLQKLKALQNTGTENALEKEQEMYASLKAIKWANYSDEQIKNSFNSMEYAATALVNAGEFKPGIMSGASQSIIDKIAKAGVDGLKGKGYFDSLDVHGRSNWINFFQDYVDNMLENYQDIKLTKDFYKALGVDLDTISLANVPGLPPEGANVEGNGNGVTGKTAVESIATGGTKSTTINIALQNLVESIIYQGGFGENREQTEQDLVSAMIRVLQMAYTSV